MSESNISKFRFVTEREFRQSRIDITIWQSSSLRKKLAKGIYWLQIEKGGAVHWNERLLLDYLLNGDRPEHQTLIEEYIASLPNLA